MKQLTYNPDTLTFTENELPICKMTEWLALNKREESAAFIVTACNLHSEFKELLREILEDNAIGIVQQSTINKTISLLAKAQS